MKNYYQILGLEKSASKEEIKKAFRLYATKFHPDKQNGDKFFEERFKEINEAYEILSDDSKRNYYDLLFNQKIDSHTNTNYQKNTDQDISRREEELRRKETEIRIKKEHLERSERFKKEYELSKVIYYKDNHVIISGVNIQINNKVYSFDDFQNVKTDKEQRERTDDNESGKTIYGVISLSFIIGVFTIGAVVGVLLIIIGFLLLIYVIFSKIFKAIYLMVLDWIWPKYQLVLISKNGHKKVFESNKYRILKISKLINDAIEKYYAT